MVKDLVEERLKVLGKIPENYDNLSNGGEEESLLLPSPQQKQQKFINSSALVGETPGKVRGPKKNLAKELDKDTEMKKNLAKEFYKDTWVKRTLAEEFDKDTWVKRNLAEEFGSVAKATDLNFVYVSPSKATKDDKDAKVPAYGRGCRGRRTVMDEDVADKKKAVQAEAALKRKEKDDAKTKEADECAVTNDEVLAEENKFSPESDVENQKVGKGNEKKKKIKGGVLSEAEPPNKKQKKIDSRFDAYELERNRPLMDQKTIDDMVKALVEERLKVLGKIPENYDNLSNGGEEESLSLPSRSRIRSKSLSIVQQMEKNLAKEFDKDTWVKRTLAEEFDKDTGVKRTLAEEFGSVAKATDLNFVYVSPSKSTKDDKDAKVPAYGRGYRGRRTVKDEDAADKKKAHTHP
ncbi:hypothetical protein F2Q69_00031107 [Brassica cretica]|uniref:Uncharacterized protein n=1 Tax=Brassica cretica TaxID=69181 RepID=A0A8S9SAU9_BRACR|nr:hypothetical protein F2Q69_00031107 [Brassica cretica]